MSESAIKSKQVRINQEFVNFGKYFAEDEVLPASEFWDYISGAPNTMETILEIINQIAAADFPAKREFPQNKSNVEIYEQEYMALLSRWQLNREKVLIENETLIKQKINGNKALTRIFNQDIFIKGDYNENRISQLLDLTITS